MIRNRPGVILITLFLTLLSPPAMAELYRWVDEEGEVHFSDKPPADSKKSSIVSPEGENKVQYTGRQKPRVRPIMRPGNKTVPMLHLAGSGYVWKRNPRGGQPEKIGIYHVGKGCTTRGAITAPAVFTRHKQLLPRDYRLAHGIIEVIEELDYPIEQTMTSILSKRLKATGGIVMQAEITAMNLKTCAPKIYQEEKLKPPESIQPYKFSHNRVSLRVRWQLRDNSNRVVLYETETEGVFDGWNKPTAIGSSVGAAMQQATENLFAMQEFVDRLLSIEVAQLPKPEQAEPKTLWLPPKTEAKGFLTSLGDMLLPDSARTRAQVTRALVEISALKNHVVHYHQVQGQWPEDLGTLGISNSTFYGSDTVDLVSLESDGSIVAVLKSHFGAGKILVLQPQIENDFIARWICFSNLEQDELPEPCRSR